jgi:spore germination cell wall hydrolase CwlJ-like protein
MIETVYCLALALYFESRSQPYVEQIATARVVLNRVEDRRYPDTVCEVVYQGKTHVWSKQPIKHQCQFSFWCDGKSDVPRDEAAWEAVQTVAWHVLDHPEIDITQGATHYHATYVTPAWRTSLKRIAQIGDSVFYRWERR